MLSYKGRSKWKSLNFTTLIKNKFKNNLMIKKRIVISNSDLGKVIKCYIGNSIKLIRIHDKMVGYKLGQFLVTKKLGRKIHLVKKKKKQKNKNKKK